MDSPESTRKDVCPVGRIVELLQARRRIRISELCSAFHEYPLESVVREVNRLHEARLVRLELGGGDYEIIYLDPQG